MFIINALHRSVQSMCKFSVKPKCTPFELHSRHLFKIVSSQTLASVLLVTDATASVILHSSSGRFVFGNGGNGMFMKLRQFN